MRAEVSPGLRAVARASALLPFLAAGCAGTRDLPVSDAHLTMVPAQQRPAAADIPPTVKPTAFLPAPAVAPLRYSIAVHELPVQELLLALARDTTENIDIHPGLQGAVSLHAADQPLTAILDRIAKQVSLRYRIESGTIFVAPDTPYLHTYRVDHVNLARDTTSSISVSGQISTGAASAAGGAAGAGGSSQTSVTTTSRNNFWEAAVQNLQSILSASRAQRADPDAKDSQDILVNQVAGTIGVMATQREHALVRRYIDTVQQAAKRQVLIECTIVEVKLSDAYRAGIDWQQIDTPGQRWRLGQELLGSALGTAPRLVLGYGESAGDLQVTVRMLEQFGHTRVLSSPKIMALNNQTALLKVVDNVVYFTVASSVSQNQTQTLQSVTTTPSTVAVGVVLSLTPQIDATGSVNLIVRPTISRIARFVDDPNPLLKVDARGVPLPNPIANRVPEIQVREMESVIRLESRQTAVLGGLIQDSLRRDRDQVPGFGRLPRVGDAFAFRDEAVDKTELVIFLRPTVVANASVRASELAHLRKYLPSHGQGVEE